MCLCNSDRSSRGLYVVFGLCLAVLVCGLAGCPKVEMKTAPVKKATPAEEATIKGYLEAAGVKGEIKTISSTDKAWIVEVAAPKPKDGKRAPPMPSDPIMIDKETGKVLAGDTGPKAE